MSSLAVPQTRRFPALQKQRIETLQVNLGRLCNQACRHCHVDSSPARDGEHENAPSALVDQLLELLARYPQLRVVDLTGGAPELNPGFRRLVQEARALRRTVFVRHNLTVQFEAGQEDLPMFFAEHGVVLYCSLPCYQAENVTRQRGQGVFDKSVRALQRLNEVGYGRTARRLELNLVYNPIGASLPPDQAGLEADYKRELRKHFEIDFDRLLTLANQPIHRFRQDLERQNGLSSYMQLLEDNFNAETLPHLMCRKALSVRWDGRLYDCDFNLVLDLPVLDSRDGPHHLRDLLQGSGLAALESRPIAVAGHCFACTAGAGSSCGGALL